MHFMALDQIEDQFLYDEMFELNQEEMMLKTRQPAPLTQQVDLKTVEQLLKVESIMKMTATFSDNCKTNKHHVRQIISNLEKLMHINLQEGAASQEQST